MAHSQAYCLFSAYHASRAAFTDAAAILAFAPIGLLVERNDVLVVNTDASPANMRGVNGGTLEFDATTLLQVVTMKRNDP